MQVQRIIKDNIPISFFSLRTAGKGRLPLAYIATADIKHVYAEYKEDLTSRHTHDFYLILWITNGYCDYNLDIHNYKIQPNTLLLLKPGEFHRFSNVIALEGIIFYFTSDVLLNVDSNISNKIDIDLFTMNHIVPITSNRSKEILNTSTGHLYSICKGTNDGIVSQEIKKLKILIFLLRLFECEEIQNNLSSYAINRNTYHIFLQFQKMVDDKYQSLHKVQDYSQILNISSKHLNECVRKHTSRSPLQIINQRLILQSQRLLLFSPLRIKEIALNLGFVDTSHFVKFFKKEMGVSPSEYRKKS